MSVFEARKLSRTLSPPEALLWNILRQRPGGHKFRRQHPVGAFILDFYCRRALLATEIDGFANDCGDNPERDRRRDVWLSNHGIATCGLLRRKSDVTPKQ